MIDFLKVFNTLFIPLAITQLFFWGIVTAVLLAIGKI